MNKRVMGGILVFGAAALVGATFGSWPETKVSAASQGQNARPSAGSAAAGQTAFVANCGFCHGGDARGGAEGGPDLTRSPIVTAGAPGLIAFLKVGRPPRMPAFDLPDAQVADIAAFISARAPAAGGRGGGNPQVILVGNADAGKAYFNGAGKCVTCHSVTGDLKGIGAKYNPQLLQGRMVLSRGSGGYPGLRFGGAAPAVVDSPRTVVVVPLKGPAVKGDLVRVSDFIVTLKDSNGEIHTFSRDGDVPKVTITDPAQAHIDMLPKWTDRDMHDVTAYLVTLK